MPGDREAGQHDARMLTGRAHTEFRRGFYVLKLTGHHDRCTREESGMGQNQQRKKKPGHGAWKAILWILYVILFYFVFLRYCMLCFKSIMKIFCEICLF